MPAALVVLAHLALDWNGADGFTGRRDLAFSHGVALAVVLAATLISSRVALHLETGAGAPVADAVAIIGSVAVLAHLARVWRDGSDPLHRFGITVEHIAALLLVALVSTLVARREQRRTPPIVLQACNQRRIPAAYNTGHEQIILRIRSAGCRRSAGGWRIGLRSRLDTHARPRTIVRHGRPQWLSPSAHRARPASPSTRSTARTPPGSSS